MASPRMSYNMDSPQQLPNQAALGPGLKSSRSTPAIPEEGPAPSITDFPRLSLDAARMMPTLLEQLQVRNTSTGKSGAGSWYLGSATWILQKHLCKQHLSDALQQGR